MHWLTLTAIPIFLSLLAWSNALLEEDFVSFGPRAGDSIMRNQLTTSIPLDSRFYVYGTPYTSARVSDVALSYAQTFHIDVKWPLSPFVSWYSSAINITISVEVAATVLSVDNP